jgi:polyisoprenoid-binding protein YceI
MKKGKVRKFRIMYAMVAFILVVQVNVLAQERFVVAEQSKMVIKGTSSIHDWETNVTEINGSGVFALNSNSVESVNNFQMSIPVKSLESGKKGLDNKVYEALKANKSPKIEFQFRDANQITPGKITVNGKMTIAGKSKDVQLTSDYKVENGNVIVNGSHSMKMTEFDVDPPTAMLGTVRAGDQIQIEYNLVFTNATNNLTSK